METNYWQELKEAMETLNKAYIQYMDGAIMNSEFQARLIELFAWLNALQIKQEVDEMNKH